MTRVINCIIEITKNSNLKYEYNKKTKRLVLDRILKGTNFYPENYGFIRKTLDYDGDPLDIIIISDYQIRPLAEVEVRIIGALEMIDCGEKDTKILSVITSEDKYNKYLDLKDIDKTILNKIKDFFTHYKILENKITTIKGFENSTYAINILEKCKEMYHNSK